MMDSMHAAPVAVEAVVVEHVLPRVRQRVVIVGARAVVVQDLCMRD